MFRDLQKMQTVFTDVAAHRDLRRQPRVRRTDDERRGDAGLGQLLSPCSACSRRSAACSNSSDDQKVGESPVVVLSHAYWTHASASAPTSSTRQMIVNGQSLTIVGVAPTKFEGTTLGATPEVFVPITLRGVMEPGFNGFANRRSYWAYLFARLKPGVTIEQAQPGSTCSTAGSSTTSRRRCSAA